MTDPSKSRIQQLRSEIAILDQKILDRPVSPVLLDSSPVSFKKAQDRSDLHHKVSVMRASILGKEEHLLSQREEAQQRLQELARSKQMELQSARSQRDPLLQKLKELKAYREQLYEAYHLNVESASKKKDVSRQANIQKLQLSLSPLEMQASELAERKAKTQNEHDSIKASTISFTNSQLMSLEDYFSKVSQRSDIIAQREEVEIILENLKLNYPHEFEHLSDWNLVLEINNKQKIKQEKIEAIRTIDKQTEEINVGINLLKNKLEGTKAKTIDALSQGPLERTALEITKLENYLKNKANELGVPTLDDLVLDLNCLGHFDIDEEILKIQLKAVEVHEARLKKNWETSERKLKDRLGILSEENDLDKMGSLEDEIYALYKDYRTKAAALAQWKTEVEEAMGRPKSPGKPTLTDNRVVEEFESIIASRAPDQLKSVDHLLSMYIQKLAHREKTLKGLFADSQEQIQELEIQIDTAYNEKLALETQKTLMRKDLMKLIIEEKSLGRRINHSEVLRQACTLHSLIEHWDSCIRTPIHLPIAVNRRNFENLEKQVEHLARELKVIETEETRVNSQIEQLLKAQRQEMLDTLDEKPNDQELLKQITLQMDKVSKEHEYYKKQLTEIDTKNLEFLAKIEQEEAMLRTQEQVIENSIQNTRLEKQKISELELRLSHISSPDTNSISRLFAVEDEPTRRYGEEAIFDQILPLLEGGELYKKFSQRNSLRQNGFDPLNSIPPESCGYGIRVFQLHKTLARLEIRQPFKPGIDSTIPIAQILAPVIPQRTMTILKVQKKLGNTDLEIRTIEEKAFEDMREWGVFDTNNQVFKKKCKECTHYPFSIVLEQGGRVEVIAKSYFSFKMWVNGINVLVKYKKSLSRLRSRIEAYNEK